MKLGHKIKKLRELRNYTQLHVSEQLNMTQSAYSKLENSNDIPLSKLQKIARVLDVQPEHILAFENLVFNLKNNKKANGIVINQMSQNEKQLYESLIESLKREVAHLKSVIDKLLTKK